MRLVRDGHGKIGAYYAVVDARGGLVVGRRVLCIKALLDVRRHVLVQLVLVERLACVHNDKAAGRWAMGLLELIRRRGLAVCDATTTRPLSVDGRGAFGWGAPT